MHPDNVSAMSPDHIGPLGPGMGGLGARIWRLVVGILLGRVRDEESHIELHGGHVGVARLNDERHAERMVGFAGQLGPGRGCGVGADGGKIGRHEVALGSHKEPQKYTKNHPPALVRMFWQKRVLMPPAASTAFVVSATTSYIGSGRSVLLWQGSPDNSARSLE